MTDMKKITKNNGPSKPFELPGIAPETKTSNRFFMPCGTEGLIVWAVQELIEALGHCPQTGSGERCVHRTIMRAAVFLQRRGNSRDVIGESIARYCIHCGRIVLDREIRDAVDKAVGSESDGPWSFADAATFSGGGASIPARYDRAVAEGVASEIEGTIDFHTLFELSPIRPDVLKPGQILAHLFAPGEKVVILRSVHQLPSCMWQYVRQDDPPTLDCFKDGNDDVFFLCNPVDGFAHRSATGSMSTRCADAITSFRYGVLESDVADPAIWLRILMLMPIPIAAIYTSGGRSIHALWRIDADSKKDFDKIVKPLKPQLTVLGADPAALTAVRLTRLPNCWRRSTDGFQKLLYLDPEPNAVPLIDQEYLRDRDAMCESLLAERKEVSYV
jgi:hypothetical protein